MDFFAVRFVVDIESCEFEMILKNIYIFLLRRKKLPLGYQPTYNNRVVFLRGGYRRGKRGLCPMFPPLPPLYPPLVF